MQIPKQGDAAGQGWRELLAELREQGALLGPQPLKAQLPVGIYHRLGALRERAGALR